MNAVTIILIEDDDGHARLVEKNLRRARASAIRSPAVPTAKVRFNACSVAVARATFSSCSISIFLT
jgi:hypothetical protein